VAVETSQNSLDDIELLKELSPESRQEIARQCTWRRYGAGEQIVDRQSENTDAYFVVSGTVRIVIYSVSGRELTLDDVDAGAFFGELAAIDGRPRSASVLAVRDTTIAGIRGEVFLRLTQKEPQLGFLVMRRLAAMVRTATDRIIDLSTLGANNRVHAEVLRMARLAGVRADGSAILNPIPMHGDMASRVSTTRETVARVMNDLARQGIVRRDRDALVVLSVERLEELVESVRGE
jgi:CRP/FNR family cyclic AMP-dependent transcriptional regulator